MFLLSVKEIRLERSAYKGRIYTTTTTCLIEKNLLDIFWYREIVVFVNPILITTFLPVAQRYVTMAALRGAVRPSSSIKSCNIHLAPLPGTALVKTRTSMKLGRHVTGLPRGVVSSAPRRGVHRPRIYNVLHGR